MEKTGDVSTLECKFFDEKITVRFNFVLFHRFSSRSEKVKFDLNNFFERTIFFVVCHEQSSLQDGRKIYMFSLKSCFCIMCIEHFPREAKRALMEKNDRFKYTFLGKFFKASNLFRKTQEHK